MSLPAATRSKALPLLRLARAARPVTGRPGKTLDDVPYYLGRPCPQIPFASPRRCFSSRTALRAADRATTDPATVKPAPATGKSVPLAFEKHSPPEDASPSAGSAQAIVICHGLFGSKQNWRSIARSLAKKLGVPIYAVDLRNHGASPHVEGMSYADMGLDILQFVKEHQLKNIALIGHSMGGKAVQSFALSPELPEGMLKYLVSVDMSSARGPLSKEFEQYVDAMLDINERKCESRKQADEILAETESDKGIRQFLLTNLEKPPSSDGWSFRVPVHTIKKYLSQIGDFPYDSADRTWDGQTLFIKGAKSKYINHKNIPICDSYFPNAKHVTVDAGHWVQAEKPLEFAEVLTKFLRGEAL